MGNIDSFLHYLDLNKGYSANTVKSYQVDLTQFQEYLSENYPETDIQESTAPQVRSWIVNIMEYGVKPRSIRRKISSLQSFYNYLLNKGSIDLNPIEKLTVPKYTAKLPQYINTEDLKTLFDKIDFTDDFEGTRDRLILEMFYSTGIRLSELVSVKHSDVDVGYGTIKVTGKGSKQRIIPLIPALINTLKVYLEKKHQYFPYGRNDYLIVTNKGKEPYAKFIYRVVYKYLSLATTLDKKSPHVLRHTFATHMLNNGAELNSIKEFLGHANLSATQVYTHNTVEKLKKIYKRAHPKA